MFNQIIYTILTAFSGDISCDFESELWHRGYCSWSYAEFNSSAKLSFKYELPSDPSTPKWKNGKYLLRYIFLGLFLFIPYTRNLIPIASFPRFQGNHYVQLNESGNITILSSLETSCSRIHDEAKIGFYYKLTDNSSVSKILIMYIIFDRQE